MYHMKIVIGNVINTISSADSAFRHKKTRIEYDAG